MIARRKQRHPVGVFSIAGHAVRNARQIGEKDIVLAALLLLGSVTGAQLGAKFAQRMRPEYLRLALASMVLLVAIRMALGLGFQPAEIYTVQIL